MKALVAACCLALACTSAPKEARVKRPNIVIVLTDDQGYGDFGHRGNPVLETPALDALAAECPTVERFYVSPVCSPTRACLMTGRYNYRTRVVDTWIGRSSMEPEEVTIAEALRSAGYRCGIFGKWHLGDSYPLRPQDQGFDRTLVHRGGGLAQPSEPPASARRYTDPILIDDGVEREVEGYCTDVFFEAAQRFIDECDETDTPFFAYIATNAPHGPFHDVPEELRRKYAAVDLASVQRGNGRKPEVLAATYAMIENIDANVGRLLAHLDERGLERDTLFVFACDNGPEHGRYAAGLRGHKGTVYEGGIRSPLFVRWPGRTSAATTVREPLAHIDLFPTLVEAAGATSDARVDGRSALGLLTGSDAPVSERNLVIQSHRGDAPAPEHNAAVMRGRWKLVRASGFARVERARDVDWELYDLEQDPAEERDLALDHPELVADLRAAYRAWFDDVTTTRADNFAPPRIIIGSRAEPATRLTWQDWRVEVEGGWGKAGYWPVRCESAQALDFVLLLRDDAPVDRIEVRCGERATVFEGEHRGPRIPLGAIEVPDGTWPLRVECSHAGERVVPYQVLVTRHERAPR